MYLKILVFCLFEGCFRLFGLLYILTFIHVFFNDCAVTIPHCPIIVYPCIANLRLLLPSNEGYIYHLMYCSVATMNRSDFCGLVFNGPFLVVSL
jgi:hypothetical protein